MYVNRIDYEGKAYNDQFISNRSSRSAEGIAQQMGLQTAKEVQDLKHAKRQSAWPEMRHMKQLAHQTLAFPGVRSVEGFVAAFNEAGTPSGFRAEA